jgi:HAD superfamily hydrolase (TIGR01490 family)
MDLDIETSGNKKAAFFDLDGTLIPFNSGMVWAQDERKKGLITHSQFLKAGFWNLLYKFSLIDIEKVFEEAMTLYTGEKEDSLRKRTYQWFEKRIAPHLKEEAKKAIKWHRSQGDLTVILSSCSSYEAEIATKTWGLDDWLANRLHVDSQGVLNGSFHRPLCFGPGKVHHAENWAKENNIQLENCIFYTDSLTDLPMLEKVALPKVVDPDPRLKLEAKKRAWPVHYW